MDGYGETSFVVASEDAGAKLFKCCHRYCTSLSISQLRAIFANNGVTVNGKVVIIECSRLKTGDEVTVRHIHDTIDELSQAMQTFTLTTMYENNHMCVFEKSSGVNAVAHGMYDKAVRGKAGGLGAAVPFRLPKYMSGLFLVAKRYDDLSKLLQSLRTGEVSLTFTCVVAASVGAVGSIVRIPLSPAATTTTTTATTGGGEAETEADGGDDDDGDNDQNNCYNSDTVDGPVFAAGYDVLVLGVSECRFSYHISLIEVRPVPIVKVVSETTATATTVKMTAATTEKAVAAASDVVVAPGDALSVLLPTTELTEIESSSAAPSQASNVIATAAEQHKCKSRVLADVYAISGAIKRIRVDLHRAGFRVVGDGNCVKTSKGIFMVLNRIDIKSSCWCIQQQQQQEEKTVEQNIDRVITEVKDLSGLDPLDKEAAGSDSDSKLSDLVLSIPIPPKYDQLIIRERELYRRAAERAFSLVDEWLLLHPLPEERERQSKCMLELFLASGKGIKPEGGWNEADDILTGITASTGMKLGTLISRVDARDNADVDDHSDKNDIITDTHFRSLCCHLHTMYSLPVEYLLGEVSFCGARYTVTPDVMIPRRSSECLVEAVLSEVATWGENSQALSQGLSVLDMGTGSGCLLLGVVRGLRQMVVSGNDTIDRRDTQNTCRSSTGSTSEICALATIGGVNDATTPKLGLITAVGTDISSDALVVACANKTRLLLDTDTEKYSGEGISSCYQHQNEDQNQQIYFVQNRFSELNQLKEKLTAAGITSSSHTNSSSRSITSCWNSRGFDVILCNPPYSVPHDISRISRQALEMEPTLALCTEQIYGAYKEIAEAFNSISMGSCVGISNSHHVDNNNNNQQCDSGIDVDDTNADPAHSMTSSSVLSTTNANTAAVVVDDDDDDSKNEYMYAENIVHSGTIVVLEIGAGQHDAVREIFQTTVPSIVFVKYILDYNQLIRGLMFKFV